MKSLAITTLLIICTLQLNAYVMREYYVPNTFSERNLYSYIVKVGIKYPNVVMAQAKLESGHFTSHIFKKNHNLFGMKFPRQRKTTAIGANKGHSLYTNWKSSVLDYKLWQDAMIHRVNDEESYLLFLKKRYASDPTYVKQLKIMLNENNRI